MAKKLTDKQFKDWARKSLPSVSAKKQESHDCWENAVPYVSKGPLGHGWECGVCGNFLQAG